MNSPHRSGFSGIKIVQKYAVFDGLKCEKLLQPFAFGRRCWRRTSNWTAVFSYDRLPCKLLRNAGMEVRRK